MILLLVMSLVIVWALLGALGSLLGRSLLMAETPTLTIADWAFLITTALLFGPTNIIAVAIVWGFIGRK